jgi:hypothetical protein
MNFDLGRLNTTDRVIVGGAVVVFVSAFLPWWGYSGPLAIYSASVMGWSAGFTAWAGIVLLVAAGAYVVLLRSEVKLPNANVGRAVLVAGAAVIGFVLVLLRWLTMPRVSAGLAGSIGPRYGLWLAVLAGLVETAAAVVALRASGEPLPWAKRETGSP